MAQALADFKHQIAVTKATRKFFRTNAVEKYEGHYRSLMQEINHDFSIFNQIFDTDHAQGQAFVHDKDVIEELYTLTRTESEIRNSISFEWPKTAENFFREIFKRIHCLESKENLLAYTKRRNTDDGHGGYYSTENGLSKLLRAKKAMLRLEISNLEIMVRIWEAQSRMMISETPEESVISDTDSVIRRADEMIEASRRRMEADSRTTTRRSPSAAATPTTANYKRPIIGLLFGAGLTALTAWLLTFKTQFAAQMTILLGLPSIAPALLIILGTISAIILLSNMYDLYRQWKQSSGEALPTCLKIVSNISRNCMSYFGMAVTVNAPDVGNNIISAPSR